MTQDNLLEVKNLTTRFKLDDGILTAVDGISFEVGRNQTVGIVGESGCGKSVTSFSILQLVAPPGKVEAGEIIFDGQNLLELSKKEMRKVRGKKISMIFRKFMPDFCDFNFSQLIFNRIIDKQS